MGNILMRNQTLLIYDTLPFLQSQRKSAKRIWLFHCEPWEDRVIVGFLAVPHSSPSPATLIFLINLQSPASFPSLCTDSSPSTSNNTRDWFADVHFLSAGWRGERRARVKISTSVRVCVRVVTHVDCLIRRPLRWMGSEGCVWISLARISICLHNESKRQQHIVSDDLKSLHDSCDTLPPALRTRSQCENFTFLTLQQKQLWLLLKNVLLAPNVSK